MNNPKFNIRDKLNEAAITYAKKNTTALNPFGRIMDDFKAGAEWLMQQPLADRLTEEEKEKIMQIYRHASYPSNRVTFAGQTVLRLFPGIFGKELFNEK